MHPLIIKAASFAPPTVQNDPREYWIACIGVRNDSVEIISRNGSIQHLFSLSLSPSEMRKNASYHAEGRVLRKMTRGGEMYVARVSRQTGGLVMSRPCRLCQAKIRSYRIDKVYYSINDHQYGVWLPQADTDRVF